MPMIEGASNFAISSSARLYDDVGRGVVALAISANGSLLATADHDKVKLCQWSENDDSLAQIKDLQLVMPHSMAFSLDNILVIATRCDGIKFYNVKTHSFIRTLPLTRTAGALAFSPDCTRLAVGDDYGDVNLWDIRGIDASSPPSKEEQSTVTALAFSQDCSRLACGFFDGTVELWGTSPTKLRIRPLALHSKTEEIFFRIFRHSEQYPPNLNCLKSVHSLGFDTDGKLFASGSGEGTIKLWNGGDGTLYGILKAPGRLQTVALSNSALVAGWKGGVTLWSLDTLSLIHSFTEFGGSAFSASLVSIAENSALITVTDHHRLFLLDALNHKTAAAFNIPVHFGSFHTMTFLPDNSQLVVQSNEGVFLLLDLVNKCIINGPTLEHLMQLPNTPLWHGVPFWHCQNKVQHYFALFSQHKSPVPVLWVPRQLGVRKWTQGSSMIAFACDDGRVILLRLPASHVC